MGISIGQKGGVFCTYYENTSTTTTGVSNLRGLKSSSHREGEHLISIRSHLGEIDWIFANLKPEFISEFENILRYNFKSLVQFNEVNNYFLVRT